MLILGNRIKETSGITGLGAYTLAGAAAGFRGLVAGWGNGNSGYYCAEDGVNFEINRGIITDSTPDSLSRAKFLDSSTGSPINWGAGTKNVFSCLPAQVVDGILIDDDIAAADSFLDWAMSSAYAWFELRFRNVRLSADGAQLLARISIAASIKSDATYQSDILGAGNNAASVVSATTGTSIPISGATDNAAASAGISGAIRVHKPGEATILHDIEGWCRYRRNTDNLMQLNLFAAKYTGAAGAFDALRVLPDSGNISVGDFAWFAGGF